MYFRDALGRSYVPVPVLAALMVLVGACSRTQGTYVPGEGDVLFQSLPPNELVDMIEGSTRSPFSHCGIVARRDSAWVVIEAIGSVIETPLDEWIARGRDGAVHAFRLLPRYHASVPAFIAAARRYLGRPYDYHYAMDDVAIYCSELPYKAFLEATGERMGRIVRLGELQWQPYESLIRRLESGGLPLEREIITPRDLALATQLQGVAADGR